MPRLPLARQTERKKVFPGGESALWRGARYIGAGRQIASKITAERGIAIWGAAQGKLESNRMYENLPAINQYKRAIFHSPSMLPFLFCHPFGQNPSTLPGFGCSRSQRTRSRSVWAGAVFSTSKGTTQEFVDDACVRV